MTNTTGKCADCGGAPREMTPAAIRKGSMVREPGELLCAGCSSSRVLMLRKVDALPTKLADIKALRAPSIRKVGRRAADMPRQVG